MRPSIKALRAMDGAVTAMLAGCEGEGDWPEGVTMDDMEDAATWIADQIGWREARAGKGRK